jgi:hypothetical protein
MKRKIRRFFRRLFLQKIEYVKQMMANEPVRKGYLLGYVAVPDLAEIKTIKRVETVICKHVQYMAVVEPKDPSEISPGVFEYENIIIPSGQIKII